MKKRAFLIQLLLLLLLLLFCEANAQSQFIFREGLAVGNCHQYGRQAVYVDQFAFRYFSPGYKTPKAGQVLFTNSSGQDMTWQEIKADTSGKFTGRNASNGYIYLTYNSAKEQGGIINMTGNAMFWLNGEPHAGDPYEQGYLNIPVRLKKGLNEIYVRTSFMMGQGVKARIIFPESPVTISTEDPTLPIIVSGHNNVSLLGGVVIINTTSRQLSGLKIRSNLKGNEIVTDIPSITPYSSRKVPFRFNGSAITGKATTDCELVLLRGNKTITRSVIKVESVNEGEPYTCTFISDIDGSVQYYAVNPRSKKDNDPPALFLSVHGAGVEAIGQARAYKPKDWGVLIAPTNRRPRGFNWEDWGRIDALEVLDHATKKFTPDPARIYLTGHSMGGHGTWYLGATYPGKWAAIAPCAGYPTLMAYGSADGRISEPGDNIVEKNLYRASNGSNVIELAGNYGAAGVYVFHGDDDRTVSVEYARQMRQVLGKFHSDFSYYEYPGGSHWWSSESVDWLPLFEYFRWHKIIPDSSVNRIDFTTANPAVSSQYRWTTVLQQKESLKYSRLKVNRDKVNGVLSGETENISVLKLQVTDLRGDSITVKLDGDILKLRKPDSGFLILSAADHWVAGNEPDQWQKNNVRNGTIKEAFNNRMVFIYGTAGTKEENGWSIAKARYDAEMWYYRGNGSVDVLADKDFNPADYPDRGIIIYGNATTNSSWMKLLAECPVQVSRGSVSLGKDQIKGDNFGAYLVYPRKGSSVASVTAISGTGLPGMHAADANQYFTGGSGFPDFIIFSSDMMKNGISGINYAGFYNNNWKLED